MQALLLAVFIATQHPKDMDLQTAGQTSAPTVEQVKGK